MSSRLGRDALNRLIVVVTAPSLGQNVGDVFLVRGNTSEPASEGPWTFLGRASGSSYVLSGNPDGRKAVLSQ